MSFKSRKHFTDEQDLFFEDNYKEGERERWGSFKFEYSELVNE